MSEWESQPRQEMLKCKVRRKKAGLIANDYHAFYREEGMLEDLRQVLEVGTEPEYLNRDLRYFNFKWLAAEVQFQVVVVDPPWRIRGGQQNDSQFMFNNSKFSLEYNTMANADVEAMPLQELGADLVFMWILNTMTKESMAILNRWGYEVRDQLVWVKLKDGKVFLTHGYYFMHSYEICLVGARPGLRLDALKVGNLIFAEVAAKSQKPV
jgi:N6-adenosine-specific RNA methylase IME4